MLLFTTGVVNEVDAAAVGLEMANQIRDDVVLHPAWELVEEFTPSSGPRWTVLKCLATESGLVADFFVVIELRDTGVIRMATCEEYNAGTHTMSFGPTTLTGSNQAYDALGRSLRTFVLNTDSLGIFHYQSWTPSGNNANWWVIVADDGLTVAFNGASYGFIHVGAYIPLTPLEIELPLQIIGQSTEQGAVSRNPAVAGQTVTDAALSFRGGGGNYQSGPPLGFAGSMKANDALQGGRTLAELGMVMYNWFTDSEAVYGWALGKQTSRMRCGAYPAAIPAGFTWGDSYVVDGNLWVPWYPTDHRVWDTGVAA